MKVSVIIPVYNVERYLVRCLDSVVASARQFVASGEGHSVEVICVDDGSTDRSPALLSDYVARTGGMSGISLCVFTKENGGQGSARNLGLDHVTGDYVMFVDADDYIPTHAISVFSTVAAESNVSLVVSLSFLKDCGKGVPLGRSPTQLLWKNHPSRWIAGKKVQYSVCNKFYRADSLKKMRFVSGMRAFEDYPFITEVFCRTEFFAAIRMPLYVYCINPSASSTIHSPFSDSKLRDAMLGVRMVLENAKGSSSRRFALRQAADGLSSTIGKVYKSCDHGLWHSCCEMLDKLFDHHQDVLTKLSPKARLRLWCIRKRHNVG